MEAGRLVWLLIHHILAGRGDNARCKQAGVIDGRDSAKRVTLVHVIADGIKLKVSTRPLAPHPVPVARLLLLLPPPRPVTNTSVHTHTHTPLDL